jgi:hypothetical protein
VVNTSRRRAAASAPSKTPIKVIKAKSDIAIDEGAVEQLLSSGYDLKQAELHTTSVRECIEKHKNDLLALQILYSQPYPDGGSPALACPGCFGGAGCLPALIRRWKRFHQEPVVRIETISHPSSDLST